MTFEEFERAMEFVVAQQAQFAADLAKSRQDFDAKLSEWREESTAEFKRINYTLQGLMALCGALAAADKQAEARDRTLAEELRAWREEFQRNLTDLKRRDQERDNGGLH